MKRNTKKGITLIETLLYISLLSVFVTTAIPFFIGLNEWQASQATTADAIREFLFIRNRVRFLLSTSEAVISPRQGEFSDTLELRLSGGERIMLENFSRRLFVVKNSDDPVALHASSTAITDLTFYRSNTEPASFAMKFSVNGIDFGTTTYSIKNE